MKYYHFTAIPPKTGFIAHRGISSQAPENTMVSFRLAADQGIDWIEFDLRLTKDNILVMFHDDELSRTTNGSGRVDEKSWDELKQLDAGSWFNSQFQNERIPLFSEAIRELVNLNLSLNIELKLPPQAPSSHADELILQLTDVLKNQWPTERILPLISSFHWELLDKIREIYPDIPIGFLQDECTLEALTRVSQIPNAAFHCQYESITQEIIEASHQLQVPLLAYTVNTVPEAKRLRTADIFGIFSDNPRYLLGELDRVS